MDSSVARQRWRQLLFFHWAVPAEALQARLPAPLVVDTFQDRAYVGLIALTMPEVRLRWPPSMPALTRLHALNLRTYVHRDGRRAGCLVLQPRYHAPAGGDRRSARLAAALPPSRPVQRQREERTFDVPQPAVASGAGSGAACGALPRRRSARRRAAGDAGALSGGALSCSTRTAALGDCASARSTTLPSFCTGPPSSRWTRRCCALADWT